MALLSSIACTGCGQDLILMYPSEGHRYTCDRCREKRLRHRHRFLQWIQWGLIVVAMAFSAALTVSQLAPSASSQQDAVTRRDWR